VNHSNVISGSGAKYDKIHELPKFSKGLVCCFGKNEVLTHVLYVTDVIDSEDLTVIIFSYMHFLFATVSNTEHTRQQFEQFH